MRTYWQIFVVGLQNTLVYRVNFFSRALFSLVPMVAAMSLWRALYEGRSSDVAGYTLAQMFSYYLLVTVVEAMTATTEDEWQIAADIKDGQIGQFLIRPVDYIYCRLCLFFAGRAIYILAAFVPVTAFVLWHRQYLVAATDVTIWICFGTSLILSALLQFLLCCLVAMLAFWVLEISSFSFILLAAERLASGQMFPLDILPAWLSKFLVVTPFACGTFFPVSVFLGRITGAAIAQGIALQMIWVVILYSLVRIVWRQGLRTYTIVGG